MNAQPAPVTKTISVTITAGGIFNQQSDFLNLDNVLNPINVEIISQASLNTSLNFCYNHFQSSYPVSGAGTNMPNCPKGSFTTIAPSTTSTSSTAKLTRQFNQRSHLLRAILDAEDTSTNASQIYVVPSDQGGIIVSLDDNSIAATFQIKLTYLACPPGEYPIGQNNTCAKLQGTITTLPNQITVPSIAPSSWVFYSFNTNAFSSISNNIITLNLVGSTSTLYLQQGYIPSANWALASATSGNSIEIYTPGSFAQSQTYFVGIFNSGTTADASPVLNITLSNCANDTTFGYNCQVSQVQTDLPPIQQITSLTAALTLAEDQQTVTTNNGTAWVFSDYNDDGYSGQYLYFLITDIPDYDALRITVGANDNTQDAPNIYAKSGGYPSSLSFDYAVQSTSVSSQLVIPISPSDMWYVAVSLPADFSIWVGTNCANNCSQQLHGNCYCSTVNSTLGSCQSVSSNGTSPSVLYIFPTNTGDSVGICECEDDLFGGFECTDVLSYQPVVIVFIVTIVTAIILAIVIAVPSYFYLKHKKRMLYEQL